MRPFYGVLEHRNSQRDVSTDASVVCDNAASLRDTIKGTLIFVPVQTHMHHKIYEAYSAAKCAASHSLESTVYRQTHTQITEELRVYRKGT